MGVVLCPRCKPVGTKVTTVTGRRLGFSPEALYVGYLVPQQRDAHKKPPATCPNCGSLLEVLRDKP